MINTKNKFTLHILPTTPGNNKITFHSCEYINGGLKAFDTKGAALRYIHAHMFWDIETRGCKWTTKTSSKLPFNQAACEEVLSILNSSYIPSEDIRFQQFVKNFTYLNNKKANNTKQTKKVAISRPKLIAPDNSPVYAELTETVQKQQETINKLNDEMKQLREMVLSMKDEIAEKDYVTVDLVVPEPSPIPVKEEEAVEEEEPDPVEEEEPEEDGEVLHEDPMMNFLMKQQLKLDNPEDSDDEEEEEEEETNSDLSTEYGRAVSERKERIEAHNERMRKYDQEKEKSLALFRSTSRGQAWAKMTSSLSS